MIYFASCSFLQRFPRISIFRLMLGTIFYYLLRIKQREYYYYYYYVVCMRVCVSVAYSKVKILCIMLRICILCKYYYQFDRCKRVYIQKFEFVGYVIYMQLMWNLTTRVWIPSFTFNTFLYYSNYYVMKIGCKGKIKLFYSQFTAME